MYIYTVIETEVHAATEDLIHARGWLCFAFDFALDLVRREGGGRDKEVRETR